MRDKDLVRYIVTVFALLLLAVSSIEATPSATRFVISTRPAIIFTVLSEANVLSWKRYPSLLPGSSKALPYPAGGVVHLAIDGRAFVVSYLVYDPRVAAEQASKFGQEARIRHLQSRPKSANSLLNYSTYRFSNARGMKIVQGTRSGKAINNRFETVVEAVVSSHNAECDITSTVMGYDKESVAQQMKPVRQILGEIASSITIH